MLLVFLCELIIFLLNRGIRTFEVSNYFGVFQILAFYIAIICIWIWSVVTFYAGIFIFLTEYHSAVGKFLDRFLFLRRRVQPMCLRVFAYSYVVIWNLSVALYLFLVLGSRGILV